MPAPEGPMRHIASTLAAPAALHRPHILVVDDSLFFRECIELILNDAGATVSCAANGAEALRLLDRDHYDCLLLDLHMPVMGGCETIQHIRATPAVADVKIIVMSAEATANEKAQCLAVGADEVISKSSLRYDLLSDIAHGVLSAS